MHRPDALDGALRRPGRFDRELLFPLPNVDARASILHIHTRGWGDPPSPDLRRQLAALTAGYCGADLKVLSCLLRYQLASAPRPVWLMVVQRRAPCCTVNVYYILISTQANT